MTGHALRVDTGAGAARDDAATGGLLKSKDKTDVRWHEALVLEARAAIREELAAIEAKGGVDARRQHIARRVDELDADGSSLGRLQRYIYVISALVQHERHGGLTDRQITGLTGIAEGLLHLQGIKPMTSNLSFLYGDLHLVLSQIHRRAGQHWKATWEAQLALQLSRRHAHGRPSFQALSIGIRALRLGHASAALDRFAQAAAADDLPAELHRRARLYEIKTRRLLCQDAEAEALDAAMVAAGGLDEAEERELAWERLCRAAATSGDLAPLLTSVRRDGPHAAGTYVAEAYLWVWANRRTSWRERLPSLRTLTDAKVLKPREMGFLYQCLKQLVACEDETIPYMRRVRALGDLLDGLNELVSIEQELLMWLAAARWLARTNNFTLSALALKEYTAGSLRLSDGTSRDVLRLAADLEDRSWVSGQESA